MSKYASKLPSKRDIALSNAMYAATAPDHKRATMPNVIIPPAPIKRRQRTPSDECTEHQEQVAVVAWWGLQCKAWGYPRKALFAIPNGQILMAHADNKQAVMGYLRSEGFRDGIPDLMLAIRSPRGEMGLFVEMKRAKSGIVSDEQSEYIDLLRSLGYAANVCHGAQAAQDAIRGYLGR